ncbi:MAG: Flp pilus assembly protein CpaB [Thermoguttaceae bacterium]|nr:Flp pilus assembly protein CpaB [Thermoguttaceae bacterium]
MHYKLFAWLIVALACGVGCSFVVKAMLQGDSAKAPLTANGPQTQIMVAKADLTPGTELGPQNIRFDLVPEDKVPQNAIFRYEGIAGRKVVGNIARNKPISRFDLEMKVESSNHEASFIPPGFSVVPIRIENVTSGGTFSDLASILKLEDVVSAGDRVSLNVLLEERVAKQGESLDQPLQRIVSKPLVENVSIYSVQTELLPDTSDRLKKIPIVSVLLDREKTNQVKVAMREGKLRMMLTQGKASKESLVPGRPAEAAPIAVNILSNLGQFRTDSPQKSSGTPQGTAVSAKVQTGKAVSSIETPHTVVKPGIAPASQVTEKRAEVKVAADAPATASSNATFLNGSSHKKQKESTVVETPKKPEATPKASKAPQEKERIQESNNGFRPRPASNTESVPAGQFHVLRPASLLPQQLPAVTAPRSGLSIAEENGVGSNF